MVSEQVLCQLFGRHVDTSNIISENFIATMEPEPVEEKNMPATEKAIAELFDDIDPSYFAADGFDPTAYELNKMAGTSELDLEFLERECFRLKRQAQVLSKKVSGLIMQNSLGFGEQVKHYSSVQTDAHEIFQSITELRKKLALRRRECRTALSIVANHRKQRYLEYLKSTLKTIHGLYCTQHQLKEFISAGDFPTAMKLCVDTINETRRYKHFNCVEDVSRSLVKILGSMEFYIDDALAAQTIKFDVDRYCLLKSSYEMLGKTEKAAQKLQRFFRATIDSSARSALVGELKICGYTTLKLDSMCYEELCQATPVENIVSTNRALLTILHKVLCLYHVFLRFHIDEDDQRLLLSCSNNLSLTHSNLAHGTMDTRNDLDAQPIVEKGVFQKSLIDNLYSIFKCAALKFNALLCCCDLTALKFDQFIEVVEMSNRFRKFGHKHFGNHCVEVALSLEKQSLLYFQRYHIERMDELKMFLESEAYALCPVSVQFTLFDLPEFHFLKESSDSFDDDSLSKNGSARLCQVNTDHLEIGEQLDFLLITCEKSAALFPTNISIADSSNTLPASNDDIRVVRSNIQKDNSILTDDNSSVLERSSSDDSIYSNEASMQDSLPNLCNTALNVLRFFGRYIRMTSILRSISELAITSIIQLYKYFLYSTYVFFCVDFHEVAQTELDFSTSRLRNLTNAIRAELFRRMPDVNDSMTLVSDNQHLILMDEPSRTVDVEDSSRIFALVERIVGVESLIFLAKQLELLRPVLESLTKKKSKALDDFYKSVIPVTVDLRRCAYGAAMSRVFDYGDVIRRVISVKWDIQDIRSEHNAYIDFIINECSTFKNRLADVAAVLHISNELNTQLWSTLLECLFRALVQGNAEASKKCSNEGRALMLLDYESLSSSLEILTTLRPLPQKAYLENYIKAFYLPQDDLGEWIIHHTEYTVGEVTALLNANSSTAKKSKFSTFMNILERRDLIP